LFWNTLKLTILSLFGNIKRDLRVVAYLGKVKIVKIVRKDNRLPAAKFPCFVMTRNEEKVQRLNGNWQSMIV
jgi:hypothetical protein